MSGTVEYGHHPQEVNGHLVTTRKIAYGGLRWVCTRCHAERLDISSYLSAPRCPYAGLEAVHVRPVPQPDSQGRSWAAAAVRIGDHRHVSIRHGRPGQRVLLGKLVCGEDVWPALRSALETLGDVAEAEA